MPLPVPCSLVPVPVALEKSETCCSHGIVTMIYFESPGGYFRGAGQEVLHRWPSPLVCRAAAVSVLRQRRKVFGICLIVCRFALAFVVYVAPPPPPNKKNSLYCPTYLAGPDQERGLTAMPWHRSASQKQRTRASAHDDERDVVLCMCAFVFVV